MRKMGNFRGLSVYLVTDPFEWQNIKDNHLHEEKMYVFGGKLTYHGTQLADVYDGQLFDFDKDKFNELRRKRWSEDEGKLLAKATGSAETRPQEERKPVKETVETPDRIVDEFLASWQDNIDNEIAVLKSAIAQMAVE